MLQISIVSSREGAALAVDDPYRTCDMTLALTLRETCLNDQRACYRSKLGIFVVTLPHRLGITPREHFAGVMEENFTLGGATNGGSAMSVQV